jgi:hypothetical protein
MISTRTAWKLAAALALLAGAVFWLRSDFGPFDQDPESESKTAVASGALGHLSWLAGCWEHQESGFRREEQWMAPRGGTMLGMSRTVAGGKTVEHEALRIEMRDPDLVFVANPSGQPEAEFRQYELSDSVAAFEAPEHDFPQRIIYRLLDRQRAVASIEGEQDGLTRVIDFPMTRTDCP